MGEAEIQALQMLGGMAAFVGIALFLVIRHERKVADKQAKLRDALRKEQEKHLQKEKVGNVRHVSSAPKTPRHSSPVRRGKNTEKAYARDTAPMQSPVYHGGNNCSPSYSSPSSSCSSSSSSSSCSSSSGGGDC